MDAGVAVTVSGAGIGVAITGLFSTIGAVIARVGAVATELLKVSTGLLLTPMTTGLLNKSVAERASPVMPPAKPHSIAIYNLFFYILLLFTIFFSLICY